MRGFESAQPRYLTGRFRCRRRPAAGVAVGRSRGARLVEWFFTRSFRSMQGQTGGSTGVDDLFASQWGPGIGTEIMGRNEFGPRRGPWADHESGGAGGAITPPFHTPVFVLTHHPRPTMRWRAGATFHCIGSSPRPLGWRAPGRPARVARDIRIGGGPDAGPPVPGRRPDRLPARRDRADRARPGRAGVGRPGRAGRPVRDRISHFAQRRHASELYP